MPSETPQTPKLNQDDVAAIEASLAALMHVVSSEKQAWALRYKAAATVLGFYASPITPCLRQAIKEHGVIKHNPILKGRP